MDNFCPYCIVFVICSFPYNKVAKIIFLTWILFLPGGLNKSSRKPLSTIDTNSANNLHLFGAKATPELQLGKLGSFLEDNDRQKENRRLFGGFSTDKQIGGFSTDQQFGGFSVVGEYCCPAALKLGLTEKQLSEARLKLKNTEDELRLATDKISISNR